MDYRIKVEEKPNGMAGWLETESTGEKTIIFKSFYDKNDDCVSEEIVGWFWGEPGSEDDVIKFADGHLKAIYTP